MSYFTGICAAWVDQNPGIVTAVPTTITLVPTVSVPTPSGVSAGGTITVGGTVTSAPPVPYTTITYSTYTVTVPQVSFITSTVHGASPTVGLVPVGPSGTSPANTGKLPVPYASSTMATSYTYSPSASAGAKPSASPVYNAASSVSGASSLVLGALAAFLGLMI